ncbi:MAG: hypothetical protein ABL889_21350 [Terricaulis sp.]
MSMTSYEGRTLPSVFSDIPNRHAIQEARGRVGRLWIWILLLFGALVVLGAGTAWLANQWQLAKADAENLEHQRAELALQQQDYAALATGRTAVTEARQDLYDNIQGQPAAWRVELQRVAQETWRRELPTLPALAYPGQSQSWTAVKEQAQQSLDRESVVLGLVTDAVNARAAQLRRTPTTPAPCPDQRYC